MSRRYSTRRRAGAISRSPPSRDSGRSDRPAEASIFREGEREREREIEGYMYMYMCVYVSIYTHRGRDVLGAVFFTFLGAASVSFDWTRSLFNSS